MVRAKYVSEWLGADLFLVWGREIFQLRRPLFSILYGAGLCFIIFRGVVVVFGKSGYVKGGVVSGMLGFINVNMVVMKVTTSLVSNNSIGAFSCRWVCGSRFLRQVAASARGGSGLEFFGLSFLFLIVIVWLFR